MPIELPSKPGVIENRLASLEDPILAERLFLEHPGLYESEPPRTQRQVLAWATRRFGTAALAVTAAVSIVAGYFLTPLVVNRAPAQSAHHAAVVAAPFRPAAHNRHKAPAAQHVVHRSVIRHGAPVAHNAPVAHRVTVVHVPTTAAVPSREDRALRAKLQAQEAEIAALRKTAAAEAASAREAHARASMAIAAAHRAAAQTAGAPQAQPRTEPAAAVSRATPVDESVSTVNAPVDAPVPAQGAGTKPPPTNPNGGWSEHPPIPYGGLGVPVPIIGPADPCTPQGGRVGIVLRSILGQSGLGSHLHVPF